MKKIFLFAVLSFCCAASFSQMKYLVEDCSLDFLFSNCEIAPSFGKDSSGLQHYFEKALKKEIKNLSGEITVGL
jgi:hypothetical protein